MGMNFKLPTDYYALEICDDIVLAFNAGDFPEKYAIWTIKDGNLENGKYTKNLMQAIKIYNSRTCGKLNYIRKVGNKAKIDTLNITLKTQVDDMIKRECTYEAIKKFLKDNGISISIASISRYTQKFINENALTSKF